MLAKVLVMGCDGWMCRNSQQHRCLDEFKHDSLDAPQAVLLGQEGDKLGHHLTGWLSLGMKWRKKPTPLLEAQQALET